jgi:hypothetical protein
MTINIGVEGRLERTKGKRTRMYEEKRKNSRKR